MESLLIITGSMGAGKTSVLGEASDILRLRNLAHAAVDLDTFGLACLPPVAENNDVMYRNLQCVCKNYADINVKQILVARALEARAELELCRKIVGAANVVVCRLIASIEIMEQRVKMRQSGIAQLDYVARVAELTAILDRARLEDFTANTENRSITEIAREVLAKAGWIPSESA